VKAGKRDFLADQRAFDKNDFAPDMGDAAAFLVERLDEGNRGCVR